MLSECCQFLAFCRGNLFNILSVATLGKFAWKLPGVVEEWFVVSDFVWLYVCDVISDYSGTRIRTFVKLQKHRHT